MWSHKLNGPTWLQVPGPGPGPGSASDHQFKLGFCILWHITGLFETEVEELHTDLKKGSKSGQNSIKTQINSPKTGLNLYKRIKKSLIHPNQFNQISENPLRLNKSIPSSNSHLFRL